MEDLKVKIQITKGNFELDADFKIPLNGATCFFGESGSGKSTLMNCISGLEKPNGKIQLAESLWLESTQRKFVPTFHRSLGHGMQFPKFFPTMTVKGIIDFALENKKGSSRSQVNAYLSELGLEGHLDKNVMVLSGGESQKLALLLAFSGKPDIVLLDEITSSVDKESKQVMLQFISRHKVEVPIIFITHQIQDVFALADNIVLIKDGKIQKTGKIEDCLDGLLDKKSESDLSPKLVFKNLEKSQFVYELNNNLVHLSEELKNV